MTVLRIDFVSDVACPWCAVGLASLEQALRRLQGEVEAELHFQPFELDPNLPAGGMDVAENQARIRDRGAELGFTFDFNARSRTWNTFDAHRLLHLADVEAPERQLPLKRALLVANFSEGRDISDHAVLVEVAAGVGLDAGRARTVLQGGEFADAVREAEKFFQGLGISSVPAVIIEKRHLVSGGQPPEVFERALREIAAGKTDAT
jgi:predicted DsbA family dithiol-disulfide isomerase